MPKITEQVRTSTGVEFVTREMTEDEIAEYERRRAESEAQIRQQPATDLEKIEAQTLYTALMTDTLLEE